MRRKNNPTDSAAEGSSLGEILQAESDSSFFLEVHIQPKASSNRIGDIHGESLKVFITAPPVDGKANKAVIEFLAKLLGVSKSAVSIRSGQQSRKKRLHITGASPVEAEKILLSILTR